MRHSYTVFFFLSFYLPASKTCLCWPCCNPFSFLLVSVLRAPLWNQLEFFLVLWIFGNANQLICFPLPFFALFIFSTNWNAVLLWLLTAACIKTGRPQIARRAIDLAESRLLKDSWPEYYDGKLGRYIGKQARKYQTWSIAGYLVAKMMLEDPSHLGMISLEEDKQMKPVLKRSSSWTC